MAKLQILIDQIQSQIDEMEEEISLDRIELQKMAAKAKLLEEKVEKQQFLKNAVSNLTNAVESDVEYIPGNPWDNIVGGSTFAK